MHKWACALITQWLLDMSWKEEQCDHSNGVKTYTLPAAKEDETEGRCIIKGDVKGLNHWFGVSS